MHMNPIALAGRIILITRPEPGASATARQIVSQGGIPVLAPVLSVEPASDSRPLKEAIAKLDSFDGILLTSTNSAKVFAEAVPVGSAMPGLFAVGRKTAQILTRHGWDVTVPQEPEGGAMLGETLLRWHPEGRRFLFPRAEEGREELISMLEQAGKEVTLVTVYRTVPVARLPDAILDQLERMDAITFFSPRTVEAFLDALQAGGASLPGSAVIAALSPLTAQTLVQRQVRVDLIASRADSEGMLEALADYWHNST
ncbi:MAG: uroporphyrinogen-III synthase [Magnetococcus sp. YQC-5]